VDIILDRNDHPIYVMRDGLRAPPESFKSYALAVRPFVDVVRGRLRLRPNPHERLPWFPMHKAATVRTSPRAVHSTDLGIVLGRPAALSVMRIIPEDGGAVRATASGQEPLLVSIRYLDTAFVRDLAKVQLVAGAHIQRTPKLGLDEHALALTSSRGKQVGFLVWRPDHPGRQVWSQMAPSAGLALGALLAALAVLIISVAKLMHKDEQTLRELAEAHLSLQVKEAHAHHLAYHDTLTGLPNRALFNSLVDLKVAALAGDNPWAVLLADLDRFKQVNDTLGHQGGDQLIQLVAERLRSVVEAEDVVARLGGDEFAILVRERATSADIEQLAEQMVAALREPFEIFGTKVFIGASIGVAAVPGCDGDRSELMRMADIAMYRAKGAGRDGYRLFSQDMDESVKLRREIEHELREAIEHGSGLCVDYQPQMNASGSRVVGLEALLRWQHPARGLLMPDAFISIAEETGLIGDLGRWVMRDASAVAKAWPALSIAVNLSLAQFRTRGLAAELIEIVEAAGARPSQFELEVTEGILLDNDENVRATLTELRAVGFRIALDDFGTGYSSLSYLNRFEVDKIKIDRSFTSRLGHVADAGAIIQAVVRLGHAMGLAVSAEGVETCEQRAFLEGAGCNELQGFLFSPAVSASAVANMMAESRRAA
jgi:diguanylate cyclase (GGDEF)-like protein